MINWKRIQIVANRQNGAHRHLITGIADYAHKVIDWELEINESDDNLKEALPDEGISSFIAPPQLFLSAVVE